MTSGLFKMEGSGNDFLVGIGSWADRLADDPCLVRGLCDRRLGIGADGTLSVTAQTATSASLVYNNADGSVGEFCGNGTRCAARAAVELLGCQPELEITTGWAVIPARVRHEEVSLVLPPIEDIPRPTGIENPAVVGEVQRLVVGVPHLVARTSGLADLDFEALAAPLRSHPEAGPEGANVDFYEIGEGGVVEIRTWERGVEDETLSCGSGMVAVGLVVMAQRDTSRVEMRPASRDHITVEGLGKAPMCPTRLTGPTRIVAEIHPMDEFSATRRSSSR